jgi:hypothetical protein
VGWVAKLRSSKGLALRWCAVALVVLSGCAPDPYTKSPEGKKLYSNYQKDVILERATNYLTFGDCQPALTSLFDLYDSDDTDNRVRMAMASTYGCFAGVNVLSVLGSLAENSSALSGGGIWSLFAKMFPSATGDKKPESVMLSMSALMAATKVGSVISTGDLINQSTRNPGSIYPPDRIDDANAYLFFISMAAIGVFQNRYGLPNSTDYKKTQALPWNTAAAVNADGAAYASSIVNFIDSLETMASLTTNTQLKNNITTIQTTFASVINAACAAGCKSVTNLEAVALQALPGWQDTGCVVPTPCSECPHLLRDPTRYASIATDEVSCAAAGIVNFINVAPVGWLGP